jgi:hypothetical protein
MLFIKQCSILNKFQHPDSGLVGSEVSTVISNEYSASIFRVVS